MEDAYIRVRSRAIDFVSKRLGKRDGDDGRADGGADGGGREGKEGISSLKSERVLPDGIAW